MKYKIAALVVVLGTLLGIVQHYDSKVEAQSNTDVAPYGIGKVGDVTIYKQVYQGCELFIAEQDGHYSVGKEAVYSPAVSITAGRGCK